MHRLQFQIGVNGDGIERFLDLYTLYSGDPMKRQNRAKVCNRVTDLLARCLEPALYKRAVSPRISALIYIYIQSHSARAKKRIRASPLLSFAPIARLENRVYVTYTGTLRHGNHPVISLIQMSPTRRRKKNNSPFSRFSPPFTPLIRYCPLVSGEIAFDSWLFMRLAFHFDVCFSLFFFFSVNLQEGYISCFSK